MTKINDIVKSRKNNYKVTGFTSFEEKGLSRLCAICDETGKHRGVFHAQKVLKNGSLSKKQGISFYAFKESKNIVIL